MLNERLWVHVVVIDNPTVCIIIIWPRLHHIGHADVVKCEVFLSDMNDFKAVNEVYAEYFKSEPMPARQAVQVAALPLGVDIEISCIAVRD